MNTKYIEVTESVISTLAKDFVFAPEDDLHLDDFSEAWLFNPDIKNHTSLITENPICRIVLTGELLGQVPKRGIRKIMFRSLQATMSWELLVSSQSLCPEAFYCRFATIGKGKRGNLLFPGIIKIYGEVYREWYLQEGKGISGKLRSDCKLYEMLCNLESERQGEATASTSPYQISSHRKRTVRR